MKKTVIYLTMLLVLMVFSGTAYADTEERVVVLKIGNSQALIDNQPVQLSSPAVVIDGRTLVPLRFVGEAFGCTVDWSGETQTATVSLEGQKVEVTIGKSKALVNSEETALQVPAQLINGRTFVPLRFVGESLGADISWDGNEQKITIIMQAYFSEQLKFKVIMPSGWKIDEETNENITLTGSGVTSCYIGKSGVDIKETGIDADSLDFIANTALEEYKSENVLSEIRGEKTRGIIFEKDNITYIVIVKLLENDVLVVMGGFPGGALNKTLASEFDIITNTLSDY